MTENVGFSKRIARHYWIWRLYHLVVADAVAIQRPTKYRFVRNFLGNDLGNALDLGCGPGVFVRHMSARARYLTAVDIDRESLKRVESRNRDLNNVRFISASIDSLPFVNESVDTALFLEVLEHLRDDRAALGEIWRVLSPGGRLVISVPVPPGEVNQDQAWGHKREGYELPEIVGLLENSGFAVREHAFAEFRFSRQAAQMIRWWRKKTHLPAPIFCSWIAYLDHLLNSDKVRIGNHCPATVVLLAHKKIHGQF